MIRLNSERGPVYLERWEEVESLPGFRRCIDPKSENLKDIIGAYAFRDPVNCGLSTCRTPHNKGYVVVTNDGVVTNIGNVCGVRNFGVEFTDKTRLYRQLTRDHRNREAISNTQDRLQELQRRTNELIDGASAGKWLARQRRLDGLPQRIAFQLREMARLGNGTLTRPRVATKKEREDLQEITGQPVADPHYIDEPIGNIRGIQALAPKNDPRKLITINLKMLLEDVQQANPDEMRSSDLKTMAKQCGEVDARLQKAEKAIELGRRLFSDSNLSLLLHLAESPSETKLIRRYLKNLSSS